MRRFSVAVLFWGALLPSAGLAFETVEWKGQKVRADRVLVRFKDQAAAARTKQALQNQPGIQSVKTFEYLDRVGVVELDAKSGVSARTTGGKDLAQQIDALKATGQFEHVEPDYVVSIAATPTDAAFTDGRLWGLRNTGQSGGTAGADIGAVAAWDVTTGSSNVVVAVVDTGIRYTHSDLQANMWRNPNEIAGNNIDDDGNGYVDDVFGINAINGSGNPMDDNDHGTHCAGTIGATANGGGPHVGVAWNVRLMGLKFLSASGSGSTSDAIECINYAVAQRVDIISNSWGGGGFSAVLRDAIAAANAQGILFVVAAGNESNNNDSNPSYPANYDLPNVISVAATNRNNQLASFSNFGATTVDLGAPGVAIFSSTSGSDSSYASFDGTSMACPHVAGVAALVKARFPTIGISEWTNRLLETVTPVSALSGRTLTGGVVNAPAALDASADGVLELSASSSVNPVPAGAPAAFFVRVSDLEAVTDATVSGSLAGAGTTNFLDNGVSPDVQAGDGTYSATLNVPAGTGTINLSVNASAPGKQPASATFPFSRISPPANDAFANRIVLVGTGTSTTGSNQFASRESAEPRQPSVAGDATVWWSWTAPATAQVTITTSGSNFDTTLAIFTGTSLGQLSLIGANDDSSGVTSAVTFSATAGVTYQIQVSGYSSETGSIVLNYPAVGGGGLPVITDEPDDVTLLVGGGFSLSVTASGATSYQWQFEGTPIPGATASSYSLSTTTLANGGLYRVIVSNAAGSVTSRQARVTVNPVGVRPNNDNFAQRQILLGSSGRDQTETGLATGETSEPNHAGGSTPLNSVWYSWQAPSSGTLVVDTEGSNFDTTLGVYTGGALGALTTVASDDDGGSGTTSRVQFATTAGTTYQIAVDGFGGATGDLVLNHEFTPAAGAAPANDQFANRIAVTGGSFTGTNEGATGESGEPNHANASVPFHSVWWSWTATATGATTIDTFGSDFDTTLAVYTGGAVSSLSSVASNDDASGTTQSRVSFNATQGQTYAIAVDGYSTSRGSISLNIVPPVAVPAPTISSQPSAQLVTAPAPATFSVVATGSSLSYQWQLSTNGGSTWTNVSGANSASFNTGATAASMNGYRYRCAVTNAGGSVTSNAATLTVSSTLVLTNGVPVPGLSGAQASQRFFRIDVPAGATQLQIITAGGSGDVDLYVRRATPPTLTVYDYRPYLTGNAESVQVTNPQAGEWHIMLHGYANFAGTTLTAAYTVAVAAPTITVHPFDQSVIDGGEASFTVQASGSNLGFQWEQRQGPAGSWSDVSGATSASYSIGAATLAMNGLQFRCRVTNAGGTVFSNPATLTVNPAVVPPVFNIPPADQTVTAPAAATFSVSVGGTSPVLDWQVSTDGGVNWTDLPSSNAASYSTGPTTVGMNGNRYRCVATNSSGTAFSQSAVLTVNPPLVPPSIAVPPVDQTVTLPTVATFTVSANGSTPLAFQWQLSTDSGLTWVDIPNATNATYETGATTLAMDGRRFRAVVSNAVGTATSNAALLTVSPLFEPDIALEHPAGSGLVDGGSSIDFAAVLVGHAGAERTFVIRNAGDSPLNVSEIRLEGPHAADFRLFGFLNGTIPPNSTRPFFVEFVPTSGGSRQAALVVLSDDPDESRFDVAVAGAGEELSNSYLIGDTVDMEIPTSLSALGRIVSVRGLPRGLRYDPTTRRIIGRATRSGVFPAVVTVEGTDGRRETLVWDMQVEALPAWAVGSFVAFMEPPAIPNGGLGGLGGSLKMRATAAGAVTGSLQLGSVRMAFRGQVRGELEDVRGNDPLTVNARISDRRFPGTPVDVVLEIRSESAVDAPGLTGTIQLGTSALPIDAGWRSVWQARTRPAFEGRNRLLQVIFRNLSTEGPTEQSSAIARLNTGGIAQWAGRLADGRRFTSSFPVSSDALVPLSAVLAYPNRGTLFGVFETEIIAGQVRILDGPRPNGRWIKLPTDPGRADAIYREGFQVDLDASGSE